MILVPFRMFKLVDFLIPVPLYLPLKCLVFFVISINVRVELECFLRVTLRSQILTSIVEGYDSEGIVKEVEMIHFTGIE